MPDERCKIAIACQGGGSHTAFTAGVLVGLMKDERLDGYELMGFSGTSGGAVCAALTWSGLHADVPSPRNEAAMRLISFWREMMATDPVDAMTNLLGQLFASSPVTAELSPYQFDIGCAEGLLRILKKTLPLPIDRTGAPRLLVAMTDVLEGCGRIVCGEDLTHDDILASAAVPSLFKAVNTRGAHLWDGLFSHNPPIRALTDLDPKPDEIWVIQINPERLTHVPTTMRDIMDRRNELSGNLSMMRELDFIDKVNLLIDGSERQANGKTYKPIKVKVVTLPGDHDYASKLNRDPAFIAGLIEMGQAAAPGFFSDASVRPAAQHGICWLGDAAPK